LTDKRADLHIHSTHSDGTLPPEEIVSLARELGLAAISITDHDNVAAVQEAESAGVEAGVEIVPGVELSAIEDGADVHMLGYYIDVESEALAGHLDMFRSARRIRAEKMVAKLNKLGLGLTMAAVLDKAGSAAIGRPHVAEAMVEEGLVLSYEEVFRKYIGFGGPAYEGKYEISPKRAVELIHEANGLAVVAHPGVYLKEDTVRKILDSGVDGIETVHPKHNSETTARFRSIVKELNLVETGGSDYHGDIRGSTPFADGTVPYEWVVALRERAGQ
jgi:predicted metal-dependent phosphoesterase TrpH